MYINSKCGGCNLCSKVTKSFIGNPIKPEEMHYQCLGDVADECIAGECISYPMERNIGPHTIRFFDSHYGLVSQENVYKFYFKIGYDKQIYFNADPEVPSGELSHRIPKAVKTKILSLSKKIEKKNVEWLLVSDDAGTLVYYNEAEDNWVKKISDATKYDKPFSISTVDDWFEIC